MFNRYLIILALLGVPTVLSAADVLDQMVATVNGHVILRSDWDDELRFECLTSGRHLSDITAEQRSAALERLVDQELLREQIHAAESNAISLPEIETQVDSLKAQTVREHSGKTWEQILSEYRLTERFVDSHLSTEMEQLQFINARFRSSIQVSPDEVAHYYKGQLVPNLPASDPITLSDATPKIREILVQNKIDQAFSSWLETLRSQAQIRILESSADSTADTQQVGSQ